MIPNIARAPMGTKRHSLISTTSSDQSDDILITPCHTPTRHSSPPPTSAFPPTLSLPPVHLLPQAQEYTHHHYRPQTAATTTTTTTTSATGRAQTIDEPHHDAVSSHESEYSPFRELMYAPAPKGRGVDAETLWNRMLLVQMCCGVYNSARLNAAIETGDFERFMPAKATLELMNHCVVMRPEDVARLRVGLEIKQNKLKKVMAPAWMRH